MKDAALATLLTQAIEAHRAGDRAGAETLYRQVLARDAAQAEALHGLGMLARQAGRAEEAIRLMRAAVESAPSNVALHSDLGLVLQASGRPEEAIEAYRGALALKPDYPPALYNLGNALRGQGRLDEALSCYLALLQNGPENAELHAALGSTYDRLGRLDEARTHFERALVLKPGLASAHCSLGSILGRQHALAEAIGHFREAVALKPDYADAWYQLGYSNNLRDDLTEAIACYRKAIELRPDNAEAHNSLGFALFRQKSTDEAIEEYRRALALKPGHAGAAFNLGVALKAQGRYDEARDVLEAAVTGQPDNADARVELGTVYSRLGRRSEALGCYERVLALAPDHLSARYNLGTALLGGSEWSRAEEVFRAVLARNPRFAEAHNNLGVALFNQKRDTEALEYFHKAIELKPDYADAYHNVGKVLLDQGRPAEALPFFQPAVALESGKADPRSGEPAAREVQSHSTSVFIQLYLGLPAGLQSAALAFADRFEAPLKGTWRRHANEPAAERRLRIGYVSADFRWHSVAFFLEPVLAHHDRGAVEVYCYYSHTLQDGVTERLRRSADHWIGCRDLSDETLAERIRSDGIDVLVDLGGHTAGNRLLSFARKPAPVQVSYLGYPGTTGLSAMDWRVVTWETDPEGAERWHSERLHRLPRTLWSYRPEAGIPAVSPVSPARRRGYVSFGSMNNLAKVTDETVRVWSELLKRVEGSRMVMTNLPAGEARRWVAERFAAQGIGAERLVLHDKLSEPEYYRLLCEIDIALDPWPYNGTTTTCQSLWMGLPVVTRVGETSVSRSGYALLKAVGLEELAAKDEEEYLSIAESLANDLERLEGLRNGLRNRMERSALRDEAGFTRELEAAYRAMWRDWCERTIGMPGSAEPSRSAGEPRSFEAWTERGQALERSGRFEEAAASYARALEIAPGSIEVLARLGNLYRQQRDYPNAVLQFERAVALGADQAELHVALGAMLHELGRLDQALVHYRRAQSLDAGNVDAHWNEALCLLTRGEFRAGLERLEWRWHKPELARARATFARPPWLGREDLSGRTILLWGEQGLGDTLQFCRYVPAVAALRATVVLEVHPPVRRLLSRLPGVSRLCGLDDDLSAYDLHCPLMSLPLALGTTLDTVPAEVPYLFADAAKVAGWRRRLGPARGRRVGLAWSGNPEHRNDRGRSIPLAAFAALADIAGIELISLQQDIREPDRAAMAALGLRADRERFEDFDDTAALIECLDLVITVDTAVAHLAGALGKPVWILLPYTADWRWLLDRADSPWYPTARLYRQPRCDDWASVLQRVADELRDESAG